MKSKKNIIHQNPDFGRPREHDRKQIAIDIVEWAKQPDSINLCKFCAYYEPIIPPSKLSIWSKEDDDFRKAYECAKLFLGMRREEWLNQERLHVKAYDLNAETYDYFLKEERREKSKFENDLSKESQSKATDKQISQIDAIMSMMSKAQSLNASRNNAESNSKRD